MKHFILAILYNWSHGSKYAPSPLGRTEKREPLASISGRAAKPDASLRMLNLQTNSVMSFDRAMCDERSESLPMLFRACFAEQAIAQGILDRNSPSRTAIPWLRYGSPRRGWTCEARGASVAWINRRGTHSPKSFRSDERSGAGV
jgi:hypothetical protein